MGSVLGALAFVIVALLVLALGLALVLVVTAGLFAIGHLVGGLFGVGTIEVAATATVVLAGLGLVVWQMLKPEPEAATADELVPVGSDEPEEPEFDEESVAHCPNCGQVLDVPRIRSQRRRP